MRNICVIAARIHSWGTLESWLFYEIHEDCYAIKKLLAWTLCLNPFLSRHFHEKVGKWTWKSQGNSWSPCMSPTYCIFRSLFHSQNFSVQGLLFQVDAWCLSHDVIRWYVFFNPLTSPFPVVGLIPWMPLVFTPTSYSWWGSLVFFAFLQWKKKQLFFTLERCHIVEKVTFIPFLAFTIYIYSLRSALFCSPWSYSPSMPSGGFFFM
jgi:hypothetical protein